MTMMDPRLTTSHAYLKELANALAKFEGSPIESIVDVLFDAYLTGTDVYIFGNGGSAALASHFACDLAKNVTFANGNRRLRALSLTDNFSLMSAWSNDVGYESVFVEQLRNFLRPSDMVIAISGSGNSPNVLRALELARDIGAKTVGMTGRDGGQMAVFCDPCLIVPAHNMQIIEDLHTITVHAVSTALYNRIGALSCGTAEPLVDIASARGSANYANLSQARSA
jgi:D-sedoheptulose 7-phosphate isomerase